MKKLKLLIAPLLVLPFVIGCNNGGGDEPIDIKFSVQESSVTLAEDNTIKIHLDWEPSGDIIEFSDFTFTLDSGSTTATVTPGTVGDRPLELTVTFANKLSANDKGDLKFHYNDKTTKKEGEGKIENITIDVENPEPPVTGSWTLKLDNSSKDFGNLSYGEGEQKQTGDSITIDGFIGKTSATINFVPENRYTGVLFNITADDGKETTFTVDYTRPEESEENATINISSSKQFEDGDIIELSLEPKTWTAKLDKDSQSLGSLSYGGEEKASIDVIDYIGSNSAVLSFVPKDSSIDYTVTATDSEGNPLDASYSAATTASINLTKEGSDTFKENDEITLHLEEPKSTHLVKFSGTNCVMKDEEGNPITSDGIEVEEGEAKFYFEGNTEDNKDYLLPTQSQVSVTVGQSEFTGWSYSSSSGCITIDVTSDLTVTATADEDPGIPTEQGRATLYFRLNSNSVETKEYESIFFTGDILNWVFDNNALEFTRLNETNFYYIVCDNYSWEEINYGYQLVKGYNSKSGKTQDEQGLKWVESYKSLECQEASTRGENPTFDYTELQKISLDAHTFNTNVINPEAEPLTNCTLSITFDAQPEFPVNEYTVLIFGSMNNWITPNDGQTPEVRKEIYNNAKMTRDGETLTFTFTYAELNPGTYEFQICTELNTTIESGEMMSWHKIAETNPYNASFTIDESKAGQSDVTIEILGAGNNAHFVEPQNA